MRKTTFGIKTLAIMLSLLLVLPTVGFATTPEPTTASLLIVTAQPDSIQTTDWMRSIETYGNYIYTVGLWAGLEVWDATNPASPVKTSFVDANKATYEKPGSFDGTANDSILVHGDYLYVGYYDGAVRKYSLENPASPSLVATFEGQGGQVYDIAVHNNNKLLTSSYNGPGGVWDNTQTGEVTNPSNFPHGANVSLAQSNAHGYYYSNRATCFGHRDLGEYGGAVYSFGVNNGYLYTLENDVFKVMPDNGTSIITNMANAATCAVADFNESDVVARPVFYDNYVIFTSTAGNLIFDVSDPSNPVRVNVSTPTYLEAKNVALGNDGYLYVTNLYSKENLSIVKFSMASLTVTSSANVASTPFTMEGELAGGTKVQLTFDNGDLPAPITRDAQVYDTDWEYILTDIYDGTYDVEIELLDDSDNVLCSITQEINVTGVAGTSGVPASSNTSVNTPDAAQLQISTANLAGSGSGKTASVTGVVPMGDRIGYKEVTLTVTDEAGTYTYYEGTQKCFGNFVFDAVALDETSDTIAEGDTVKFIVEAEDGEDDERSSVYYSDAYLDEAYAAISGKADIADIEDAIDTYNDVYQLDVEGDFAGLSSPEEVLGALLGKTYTKDAPIELLNDFNEAVAAQVAIDVVLLEIKDATTDALAVEVLDDPANQTILGIPLALTPYGALGADVKASLLAEIRAIEPLKRADIIEVLEFDRCLLLLVNTSSGAALEDALLTYSTQLGISAANVTKYNNLLPGKKTRVLSDVVREDESEYFATLVEAGNAFEDAVIYYESLVEASSLVVTPQTPMTVGTKIGEAIPYGDYIFFGAKEGLASYNVKTGALTTGLSPKPEYNGGTNMILIGTDLYIAMAYGDTSNEEYQGTIVCYDISDPANPTEKAVWAASVSTDPETGAKIYGDMYGTGYGFTTFGNKLFYHGNYGVRWIELPLTADRVTSSRSYEHYSGYHRMHFEDDEHTYAIVSGNKLLDVNRYSIEFDTAYSITTHNGYMYVVKDDALKAISKATAYGAGDEINASAYASGGTTVAIDGIDESKIKSAGAIYDNFLVYAADKLLVFDISNPAAPVRVNIPDIAANGEVVANGNVICYWDDTNVYRANLDLATVTVSSATTVSALPFAMEGTVRNGSKVKLTFDNSIITTPIVREATVSGNTWVYSLTDIYNGTYDVEIALYDSGDNKLCSVTQTITVTGGEGTVGPFTGANNTENGADAAAVSIESTLVNSSKVATVTGKIPMGNRIGYKEVTLTIKNEAGATVYTGIQKSRGQYNFTAQLPLDTPEGAAFTAEVTCDGYLTPATREFHYFSEAYRETAYAAISGKSDIADIEAAIATYNDVYQLPVEGDYATLRSQDEALAMMLGETFSKDDPEYLIMCFNAVVAYQTQVDDVIEAILAAETNALALEVLTNETTGLDNQDILLLENYLEDIAPFGDLSETGKNALMAKIRANANITRAEVAEILTYDSILLLLVNTSSDADLEDALLTYSTDLEIAESAITAYGGLASRKKNAVLLAVLRINEDEYFSTLTAAGDKFEAAVTANSGGGGGGGGSIDTEREKDPVVETEKTPVTSIMGNTETPDVAIKSVFSDIKEAAWAEKYIMYLYNNQIVNGKSKDKFAPNDNITREEFVKIIVMAIGEKGEMGETEFTDVDSSAWYAPYLNTAIRLGIIKGVDEDTFGIGSEITREQMAVIIHRAAAVKNKKFSTTTEKTFTDSVADYAAEAVDALSGAGIINGYEDGTFRGNKTATRAESAKIIYGYLTM